LTFRRYGNAVIGDGTLEFDTVAKDGTKTTLPMRWTVVWEKRGANWLIVHEHTSVAMAEPK
jgi:ketosteroid isomerase-like protein